MSGSGDALSLLDSLPRFATAGDAAYKPGFDRIEALLDELGNPHLACPTVHVAGTNGKGSTASFVAAIATASGLRTGLHTSPHLVSVTERMRVDGKPAPPAWLAERIGSVRSIIEHIRPSYFEVTVALSFAWFVEQRTDLAIVEVGLGGRLDATNVIDPSVCVITDVGLDHTEILGDTIEAVAREKAGIMKFGVPVLTADSGPAVERVLVDAASGAGSPLHLLRKEVAIVPGNGLTLETPVRRYEGIPLGLPGPVQARNAALAVRATEVLSAFDGFEPLLWPDAVRAGLADVSCLSGIRGRMETLLTQPLVLADVAHNAEGLTAALDALDGMHGTGRRIVMLAMMADKPADTMVRDIVRRGATIVPVHLGVERALPATRIAELAVTAGGAPEPVLEGGPEAVPDWIRTHARPEDSVLIAGSHLIVGPVLGAWS